MAAKTVIRFYYDVLSPYSWIAFEVLCRYKTKWNLKLDLRPFFLSGVMQGSDNTPPGANAVKATYIRKDLQRLSAFYQIPLQPPSNMVELMFERGSLPSQRLLTAAKLQCPDKLEDLSRQIWIRAWSRDENIISQDTLRKACKTVMSEELTEQLISSTQDPVIKDKLKETTQEAIDLGAFGAPFIVVEVDGELEVFFGGDRFEIIAHTIGQRWEGPLVELRSKY